MHYHCEIIMPPTDDVEAAVTKILAPFDENAENPSHAFWDWWQLGGRYSGAKLEAKVPQERRDAFYEELKRRKITVSGLQFGKQELSPASQVDEVDSIWRDMCPGAGRTCPLFSHSGDNMAMDTCRVDEVPEGLTAFTLVIACDQYDGLGAETLLHKSIWNGASIQDTSFDGDVIKALKEREARLESYKEEYRDRVSVKPDWLCVTVDYHS